MPATGRGPQQRPPSKLPSNDGRLRDGQLSMQRIMLATAVLAAYFASWSHPLDAVLHGMLLSTSLGFAIGALRRGVEGGFGGAIIGLILTPAVLVLTILVRMAVWKFWDPL